jgi:hypothetical protein
MLFDLAYEIKEISTADSSFLCIKAFRNTKFCVDVKISLLGKGIATILESWRKNVSRNSSILI